MNGKNTNSSKLRSSGTKCVVVLSINNFRFEAINRNNHFVYCFEVWHEKHMYVTHWNSCPTSNIHRLLLWLIEKLWFHIVSRFITERNPHMHNFTIIWLKLICRMFMTIPATSIQWCIRSKRSMNQIII